MDLSQFHLFTHEIYVEHPYINRVGVPTHSGPPDFAPRTWNLGPGHADAAAPGQLPVYVVRDEARPTGEQAGRALHRAARLSRRLARGGRADPCNPFHFNITQEGRLLVPEPCLSMRFLLMLALGHRTSARTVVRKFHPFRHALVSKQYAETLLAPPSILPCRGARSRPARWTPAAGSTCP